MTKAMFGLKHIEYLSSKRNISLHQKQVTVFTADDLTLQMGLCLKILLLAYAKMSKSSNYISN